MENASQTREPGVAVSVRDLTHRYGPRVALKQVSFEVERGEIVALLGPNGGGKTTLFKILATLLQATSGTALVWGHDVHDAPARVRRRLGVTFQAPSVDVKLTIQENLSHHGHLYGMSGAALRRRIDEVLEEVDLADRRREKVQHLSGGMVRRVEIAKCLLHRPDVLLMDEPAAGLDPGARRTLREQLETLRESRGVTCLLTTHLMEEADACNRVALLDQGRLVALGTPRRLKEDVGGDVVTVRSRRAGELAGKVQERFQVDGHRLGQTLRIEHPSGHELAARLADVFKEDLEMVSVGKPTLDDAFAKLTGHEFEQNPER